MCESGDPEPATRLVLGRDDPLFELGRRAIGDQLRTILAHLERPSRRLTRGRLTSPERLWEGHSQKNQYSDIGGRKSLGYTLLGLKILVPLDLVRFTGLLSLLSAVDNKLFARRAAAVIYARIHQLTILEGQSNQCYYWS